MSTEVVKHNLNYTTVYTHQLKKYLINNKISNNYIKKIDPFILLLAESKFLILKILRVLPNRRIVFLAKYYSSSHSQEQYFVLKLYFSSDKYVQDYEQYLKGYCMLTDNNLATPEIIYSRIDEDSKLAYIISSYISSDSSEDISSLNPQSSNECYIKAIARLHLAKIYQSDLHLGNFIKKNNNIYYLDCDTLEQHSSFIVNRKSLDNFALFLVQMETQFFEKWQNYINYYLECLGKSHVSNNYSSIVSYILVSAKKQKKANINKFIRKTLRSCTNHEYVDSKYIKYIVNRQVANNNFFKLFIKDPLDFINSYTVKILKNGNTAKVYLINYDGYKFVIKHYLPKSFTKQLLITLKSFFILPRAINSWVFANLLINYGVTTAKPIASVVCKQKGIIQDSFYLMEYLDYHNLAEEIAENKICQHKQELVKLLDTLEHLGLVHGDFKTSNLGYDRNGNVVLLDLDSMSVNYNKYKFKKDKTRLEKCLVPLQRD